MPKLSFLALAMVSFSTVSIVHARTVDLTCEGRADDNGPTFKYSLSFNTGSKTWSSPTASMNPKSGTYEQAVAAVNFLGPSKKLAGRVEALRVDQAAKGNTFPRSYLESPTITAECTVTSVKD